MDSTAHLFRAYFPERHKKFRKLDCFERSFNLHSFDMTVPKSHAGNLNAAFIWFGVAKETYFFAKFNQSFTFNVNDWLNFAKK